MSKRYTKKQRKPKQRVYTLTEAQIASIREDTRRDLIYEAIELTANISMLALRDQFRFGAKRLEVFINKFWEILKDIENDYLDFEDCKQTLKEETGMQAGFEGSFPERIA